MTMTTRPLPMTTADAYYKYRNAPTSPTATANAPTESTNIEEEEVNKSLSNIQTSDKMGYYFTTSFHTSASGVIKHAALGASDEIKWFLSPLSQLGLQI